MTLVGLDLVLQRIEAKVRRVPGLDRLLELDVEEFDLCQDALGLGAFVEDLRRNGSR